MKQTAIEWFAEVTAKLGYVSTNILEQAKQMEKEQIMDAYRIGYINYLPTTNSEEYYNETSKSE